MTEKISREYFFDEKTKTVYYANTATLDVGYTFLGMSDNPKPKMAAAVFMKQKKPGVTGCKIREYFEY